MNSKWTIHIFHGILPYFTIIDLSVHIIILFFHSCAIYILNKMTPVGNMWESEGPQLQAAHFFSSLMTFSCLPTWGQDNLSHMRSQQYQTTTIQQFPKDKIKFRPTFLSCLRSCFTWIYITIGKKRLSQLPFHANFKDKMCPENVLSVKRAPEEDTIIKHINTYIIH